MSFVCIKRDARYVAFLRLIRRERIWGADKGLG